MYQSNSSRSLLRMFSLSEFSKFLLVPVTIIVIITIINTTVDSYKSKNFKISIADHHKQKYYGDVWQDYLIPSSQG